MNIGIDIDDTISNTYEYLFPYAQKYTIEELEKEIKDVNRDHMYATNFHNWTKEQEKEFFIKYYKKIIEQVKPKLYAVNVINKLKDEGHKIYLITARFQMDNFDVESETKKWLKNNNIKYDKFIMNAQDKVSVAKQNYIDIFIDDAIKNCDDMAEAGIKTFIMDSIINSNYQNDKLTRVYSWPHLYQEISNLREVN